MSETTGERQIDIVKLKQMITLIIKRMLKPALLIVAATGMSEKKTAQIGRQMTM